MPSNVILPSQDSRSTERSVELEALLKDKMHDGTQPWDDISIVAILAISVRDVITMLEDSLVIVRNERRRLQRVRQENIDNDDLISMLPMVPTISCYM